MRKRTAVLVSWIMAAAVLISLLPRTARAEGAVCFQKLTAEDALVSGKYVLVSSDGFAPGCLQEGWLLPVCPVFEEEEMTDAAGAVWTLDVSEEGVILTDPAGTLVAPGTPGGPGLTAGDYRWTVTCTGGLFSFHGSSEGTAVTLGNGGAFGFRAYEDRYIDVVFAGSFTLYRMTGAEEACPEDSTDPGDPSQEPETSSEESTDPGEDPEVPAGPGLFFGQLHSHTADSDGSGTPAEAYAHAAEVAGLDFLAVTDHSNSFDGAENGVLSQDAASVSETWRLGREAAQEATSGSFLALYGFEMTWQNGFGHISTFFTPGFQSRTQDAYSRYPTALDAYYQTLSTVPGSVSQFNHPGSFYGDFETFGHRSEYADRAMALLEVVSEGVADYDAYTLALELGWHVAPTNNQNNHNGNWGSTDSGRTVVYAEALTEEAFAAALANRRVYATEDADLEILYKLDGHLMGSMLTRRNVGDTVTLSASLSDPTDSAAGTVEVIVNGGRVVESRDVAASSGEVEFVLSSVYSYYYLRVTQPDGDIAVTAPVWIEQRETAQITSFSTDTLLAVQGRPFTLRVEVENRDGETLEVDQVTFSVGGETIGCVPEPADVAGRSSAVYTAQLSCDAAGAADIRVEVSGTLAGDACVCSETLSMTFLTEDLVTTIVADGTFGSLPPLSELEAVAAEHRMVLVQTDELSAQLLSSCDVLLIPAPERDYSEAYISLIGDYLRSGRTLILCGRGDATDPDSALRLNGLLEALGLTARFRDDLAFDPVNNGGRVDELYTAVYNEGMDTDQPFCQMGGCTVSPGQGTWLVKGMATTFSVDADEDGRDITGETYTQVVDGYDVIRQLVAEEGEAVLLVREDTPHGGTVFVSGGMFLGDDVLDSSGANPWDEPNGNAALLETILDLPEQETPALISIARARTAAEGETVRVQGYVTAGTAVSHNSFPGMIYVQDTTGGLGVLDFTDPGVSVGTPMELFLLRQKDGFHLLHWEALSSTPCNIQPKTPGCADAVDYGQYGDQLVKAEGKVVSRTLTEDGRGISAFILEDRDGNRVPVRVEKQIKSASTGENALAELVKEDNWVSAVGIVYESGSQTVLRVRNCDEVVLVREKDKVYRVVEGEHTVWVRKDGKSVYITVEGPGEEFLGIEVNGVMIDQGYYQTTEDGYLYFRIWPRYLRTLWSGTYQFVFRFRDGEACATLEVQAPADIPQTGDPLPACLFMMILSGGLLLKLRRRKYQR